jgi:hypothetical protein
MEYAILQSSSKPVIIHAGTNVIHKVCKRIYNQV